MFSHLQKGNGAVEVYTTSRVNWLTVADCFQPFMFVIDLVLDLWWKRNHKSHYKLWKKNSKLIFSKKLKYLSCLFCHYVFWNRTKNFIFWTKIKLSKGLAFQSYTQKVQRFNILKKKKNFKVFALYILLKFKMFYVVALDFFPFFYEGWGGIYLCLENSKFLKTCLLRQTCPNSLTWFIK